jgi:hypothetical protein
MTGIDVIFIAALMGLGWWLESINGVHCFADELFTPLPLGFGGGVYLVFERALG